jgi:CheY-like chemotaxis protein
VEPRGARFTLELPLKLGAPLPAMETASITPLPPEVLAQAIATRPAGATPPAGVEAKPPGPRRVLVCDDEPFIRDLILRALTKDGYDVLACSSAEEALAQIKAEPFDAVVTDVHLGGLDGPSLAEEAALLRPSLAQRFIFVTGDTASEAYRRLLDKGAPVIAKPFDLASLRGCVAACIGEGAVR